MSRRLLVDDDWFTVLSDLEFRAYDRADHLVECKKTSVESIELLKLFTVFFDPFKAVLVLRDHYDRLLTLSFSQSLSIFNCK